jgi:hypothetical protein
MLRFFVVFLLFSSFLSFSQENYTKNPKQGLTTLIITNEYNSEQFKNNYKYYKACHEYAMNECVAGEFYSAFDFNSLSGYIIECTSVPNEMKDVINKANNLIEEEYDVLNWTKKQPLKNSNKFHKTKDLQLELFLKNKEIASNLVKKIFNYNEKEGTIDLETLKSRALNNSLISEQTFASLKKRGLSAIDDEYKLLLTENYLHVIMPHYKKDNYLPEYYPQSNFNKFFGINKVPVHQHLRKNPYTAVAVYGALLKLDLGNDVMRDLTEMIIDKNEERDVYKIDKSAFESYPFRFKMIRSIDLFEVDDNEKNPGAEIGQFEGYSLTAGIRSALLIQSDLLFRDEFGRHRIIKDVRPITAQIGSKEGLLPNVLFKVNQYVENKNGEKEIEKIGYITSRKIDVDSSGFSTFVRKSGKKAKKNMFITKELQNSSSLWYLQHPIIWDRSNFSADSRIGLELMGQNYRTGLMYLGFHPNLDTKMKGSNYKYTGLQTSLGFEVSFPLMRFSNSQFQPNLGVRFQGYFPYGLKIDVQDISVDDIEGFDGSVACEASLVYKYHFTPWNHVFVKFGKAFSVSLNGKQIKNTSKFHFSSGIGMPLRKTLFKKKSLIEY